MIPLAHLGKHDAADEPLQPISLALERHVRLGSERRAQTALARFNLTTTAIEAGQAMVGQAAELNSAQEQVTQERDAALAVLNDWMVEFSGVARIALAAKPQQLEALQIAVVA